MSVRSVVSAFVMAAMVGAGFSAAPAAEQGQLATAPVPGPEAIPQAIQSFPSGGDPLKQWISDLIQERPELAADVANYLKNDTAGLSEAQKEAVEAGLADGLNRLGVTGFAGFLISPALLGVGAGVAAGGAAAGILLTKKSVSPN